MGPVCLQDGGHIQNLQHRTSRTWLREHEPLHHRRRRRGGGADEHGVLLRFVPSIFTTSAAESTPDAVLDAIKLQSKFKQTYSLKNKRRNVLVNATVISSACARVQVSEMMGTPRKSQRSTSHLRRGQRLRLLLTRS